jgi:hypothetical protein
MRARIPGVALLVLFGAALLTRSTNHDGVTAKNPERVPVEIRAEGELPITETVDLTNGNIHLQIPIPATTKKQ